MKYLEIFEGEGANSFSQSVQKQAVSTLESGQVLFFPQLSFALLEHEKKFLSPNYVDKKSKNMSFDVKTNLVKGAQCSCYEYSDLQNLLNRYAQYSEQLIHALFPEYSKALLWGRTSYRPVEIAGRMSSYRKDDTRLHVDAFPATPNQGHRILRVFTNVNPSNKSRVWRLGAPFEEVAAEFLPKIRLPYLKIAAKLLKSLKVTKDFRTHYDHLMLQIHDRMKADKEYQQAVKQIEVQFPAKSTWIVQTDQVSHAAMSGQYVFEQTFYLPVDAMKDPQLSPLKILEKMTAKKLV